MVKDVHVLVRFIRKVLRKLQFEIAEDVIQDIAACKPFVIERVLIQLRERIDAILWQQHQQNTQTDGPESDQYRRMYDQYLVKHINKKLDMKQNILRS